MIVLNILMVSTCMFVILEVPLEWHVHRKTKVWDSSCFGKWKLDLRLLTNFFHLSCFLWECIFSAELVFMLITLSVSIDEWFLFLLPLYKVGKCWCKVKCKSMLVKQLVTWENTLVIEWEFSFLKHVAVSSKRITELPASLSPVK